MELAFEQKQRSCLHRTAHLSLAQEQTQELIIPDSMPDASRTLICCAEPEVQSKTNREGSLLVTGTLRTCCLYADEAGGLQLLTSELPFTVKLECAELREDTQTLVRCCVRSADSRLINSRKVLLRVSVLVQADGYEPQTQTMSVLKDTPACLQLKTQTYETNAPVELSERAFQVSEELNLPDGRPQIARLVSCALTRVGQEQGLVESVGEVDLVGSQQPQHLVCGGSPKHQLHLRTEGVELLQQVRQEGAAHRVCQRHPQGAADGPGGHQCGLGLLGRDEKGAGVALEGLARVGEADGLSYPVEEGRAKLCFQLCDLG